MLDNFFIYYDNATSGDSTPTDAPIIFDSGDNNTYTVSGSADSSAQQTVLVLYDIRNILLLVLFSWLIISIYYRLKNTISSYFR